MAWMIETRTFNTPRIGFRQAQAAAAWRFEPVEVPVVEPLADPVRRGWEARGAGWRDDKEPE